MVPGVPSDAIVMQRDIAGAGAPAPACSNCHSRDRWILHQVHHRKIFRLLCTACVLKLHTTAFCPFCFSLHQLHRKSPSSSQPLLPDVRGTFTCFKCDSASHVNCVAPNIPKSPYLCPTCLNPSSKLFDLCKSSSPKAATQNRFIDLRLAKALRAAAMIAANSLNEAAEQARAEAERKAKEAISARKRSKDALERVAVAWSGEMERMRLSEGTGEAAPVSVSNQNGLLGFKPKNSVDMQVEKKESLNNGGLAERKDVIAVNKVMNGLPSTSQQLQKNK